MMNRSLEITTNAGSETDSLQYVYSLGESAMTGVAWFDKVAHPEYSPAPFRFVLEMQEPTWGRRQAGQFLKAVHQDFFDNQESGSVFTAVPRADVVPRELLTENGYRVIYGAATHWIMKRDKKLRK